MTVQLYLKDTYLFNSQSLIISKGEDEKGTFVILDQTIFYPQGGGQPSDQGFIAQDDFKAEVDSVRQTPDAIRHYIDLPLNEIPLNSKIDCFVNKERRLLNSRYHTAAHLLGNVTETLDPALKAVKGHSFPKEAYVEFQGDITVDAQQIRNTMEKAIMKDYKTETFETDSLSFEQEFYKLPYPVPENKKFRAMQIGPFPPVPCGGTHLSSMAEIGPVEIGKIKLKNNITCISYELT